MNAKTLIRRTRDGEPLLSEEIEYLVRGAVSGEIPEFQLTAWMMAVFHRGLTRRETADLTLAMRDSGDTIRFPGGSILTADKHSTGGVGDKISFLVAPLVAAAGVSVPMISGRSLGHTGGTLDKLESIKGLRTDLTPAEFAGQVERIGLCIAGQSDRLAPADRIFYALRDAASIVESIALITASILSKKAAAGVEALALDVKVGSGAFMTDAPSARRLARSLVETASLLGIRACAHLTRMEWVLGRTAGVAIEIEESIEALKGGRVHPDLRLLTLELGSTMLRLSGAASSQAEGVAMLERVWESGAGYEKFLEMAVAQGGDPAVLRDPRLLPRSKDALRVPAPVAGLFAGIEARSAGEWISEAGGGRMRPGQPVDPRIGLECLVQAGQPVREGEAVLVLYPPPGGAFSDLARRASTWIRFHRDVEALAAELPLMLEIVDLETTGGPVDAASPNRPDPEDTDRADRHTDQRPGEGASSVS